MGLQIVLDTVAACDLFNDRAWKELDQQFPDARFFIGAPHFLELCSSFDSQEDLRTFFSKLNWFLSQAQEGAKFSVVYPDEGILTESLQLVFEQVSDEGRVPRLGAVWLAAIFKRLRAEEADTFIRTDSPQDFDGLVPPGALFDP